MENPCKGCSRRAVGCHGTCEEYGAYRRRLDEVIRERMKNADAAGYRHESRMKLFHKKRGRYRKEGKLE